MRIKLILPFMFSVLLLQGCSSIFSGNTIPDETRVVDGPSLTIPPDFDLKPPSKLTKRDTSYHASEKAKGVLLRAKSVKSTNGNEGWLVSKAGKADSDIRNQLEAEEQASKKVKKSSWFSKMWGGDKVKTSEKDENHSH